MPFYKRALDVVDGVEAAGGLLKGRVSVQQPPTALACPSMLHSMPPAIQNKNTGDCCSSSGRFIYFSIIEYGSTAMELDMR